MTRQILWNRYISEYVICIYKTILENWRGSSKTVNSKLKLKFFIAKIYNFFGEYQKLKLLLAFMKSINI